MRPSAKDLIDGIAWVLDHKVEPTVEDKWAQSSLRSIRCLLQHLSARVAVEGQILHDDNADLRQTLDAVRNLLDAAGDDAWRSLRDDLAAAADEQRHKRSAHRTARMLEEENDALRHLVDRLIRAIHDESAGIDAALRARVHGMLRAYLQRQMDRERPLYFPAFTGTPF